MIDSLFRGLLLHLLSFYGDFELAFAKWSVGRAWSWNYSLPYNNKLPLSFQPHTQEHTLQKHGKMLTPGWVIVCAHVCVDT